MSDYLVTDTELESIADAIRTKGGTSADLVFPAEFISAISNIASGTDVSDTTAVASDVLDNKYFYTSGGVRTEGTMTDRGAVTGTISTKDGTYTIASGYHNGSGTVSISSTEQDKIIAGNIKSGVTLLGQAGSLTAWSYTWSSASGGTYNSSQNFSKSLAYTATGKCLVVCVAEVVGDAAAHSASITVSGATAKQTVSLAGQSYRRLGIYQCSASGNKITASISATKGTTISSQPSGSIYFCVITAS